VVLSVYVTLVAEKGAGEYKFSTAEEFLPPIEYVQELLKLETLMSWLVCDVILFKKIRHMCD
jgi:hypothetical protein